MTQLAERPARNGPALRIVPMPEQAGMPTDMPAELTELVRRSIPEVASLAEIEVAPYQSSLSATKVRRILKTFDPLAIGRVILSLRDGKYFAVDGQHRIAAARFRGWTKIPADVLIDLTYEQEAALYLHFATRGHKTALNRFHARLEAGEEQSVEIKAVLDAVGLTIPQEHGGARTGTIQAAEKACLIFRKYGANGLARTLAVLQDAFGDNPRAYTHVLLGGMAMFLSKWGDEISYKRLMKRLAVEGIEGVYRGYHNHSAGSGAENNTAGALAIMDIYNYKMGGDGRLKAL